MSAQNRHDAGRAVDLTAAQRWGWLTAIFAAALALRAFRLNWGLPDFVFADTKIHFAKAALRAAADNEWVLDHFVHPPSYPFVVMVTSWLWATLTGAELHSGGPHSNADLASVVLVGRCVTVIVATATVGAIYLLARRLVGVRAALWAAAFAAMSPVHFLEAHRVNVDVAMLLVATLSAHQAVIAFQEGLPSRLLSSFALAALAGATKYTGLYAGTLPLWVALRWPGRSWQARLKLTAAGGVAAALTLLAALSPALLNWDAFTEHLRVVLFSGFFVGAPGQDLVGDSWVYAPYLYLIFVGLPFVTGWPVYAAAIAGFASMIARNHAAVHLLAAASLPFFLLQGAATTTTARYYLPFLPFIAICAGAVIDRLRFVRPPLHLVVGSLIVGYTAVFACSHVQRVGGAPQLATGTAVQRLVEAKQSSGATAREARLVIAYPDFAALPYDALRPYIASSSRRRLLFVPPDYRFDRSVVDDAEALRQHTEWLKRHGVDVVVITSRWENLAARRSFAPREEQFYENVTGERLGYRQALHEEESYFTRSWYEWADPTLSTIWTAGIGGYKLYVRDDLLTALESPGNN